MPTKELNYITSATQAETGSDEKGGVAVDVYAYDSGEK